MSTRSCIARPVGDGWEGRYHHSDGGCPPPRARRLMPCPGDARCSTAPHPRDHPARALPWRGERERCRGTAVHHCAPTTKE